MNKNSYNALGLVEENGWIDERLEYEWIVNLSFNDNIQVQIYCDVLLQLR